MTRKQQSSAKASETGGGGSMGYRETTGCECPFVTTLLTQNITAHSLRRRRHRYAFVPSTSPSPPGFRAGSPRHTDRPPGRFPAPFAQLCKPPWPCRLATGIRGGSCRVDCFDGGGGGETGSVELEEEGERNCFEGPFSFSHHVVGAVGAQELRPCLGDRSCASC